MKDAAEIDALRAAAEIAAAARVATELGAVTKSGPLRGAALAHGRAVVEAAMATLDALGDLGWRAVVGDAPAGDAGRGGPPVIGRVNAIGGAAVAERTEAFDPLAALERRG